MMSYLDMGYDEFLSRIPANSQGETSTAIDSIGGDLSGSKVQGGVMVSNDHKLVLDLENDTLVVTDGTAERVRLGKLSDDKIGLSIKDKDGNVLMQISEGLNVIQSGNKIFQIDIDNQRFVFRDEGGNPQAVIGNI